MSLPAAGMCRSFLNFFRSNLSSATIRLFELSVVASKDSKMSDMEATTGFLKYNLWLTKLSWYVKLWFFS